jgi:hypothetical protein
MIQIGNGVVLPNTPAIHSSRDRGGTADGDLPHGAGDDSHLLVIDEGRCAAPLPLPYRQVRPEAGGGSREGQCLSADVTLSARNGSGSHGIALGLLEIALPTPGLEVPYAALRVSCILVTRLCHSAYSGV